MRKVILASESPRRRELLTMIHVNYTTMAAHIDESFMASCSIEENVQSIAYRKAKAIHEVHRQDVVIGADTIVVVDDQVLGKPKNRAQAKEMLEMLSGRQHRVLTGVAILCEGMEDVFYEETKVNFYELDEATIEWYLNTKESRDKAGAYGIQGQGALLIEGIQGDYYNVVGLPIASLMRHLHKFF